MFTYFYLQTTLAHDYHNSNIIGQVQLRKQKELVVLQGEASVKLIIELEDPQRQSGASALLPRGSHVVGQQLSVMKCNQAPCIYYYCISSILLLTFIQQIFISYG